MTDYKIIIPARYNSKRFPGKPLVKIHGKTMLERVWLNAMDSAASEVIIATDDHRIEAVAKNFVLMFALPLMSINQELIELLRQLKYLDLETMK